MKKVLIVFGTRPEAIKMAPVVMQFQKYQHCFETKICVTSQHREMLDQVLEIYGIKPGYDLDVMKSNQDLFGLSGLILLKLRDVLTDFNPNIVLVHGDTTTSFTASLAAFYKKIPVAHVEAGLRSGNITSPWPEEMNRKLTSVIASFHFAPSVLARENLLAEGVHPENIFVTGNTVVDALLMTLEKINSNQAVQNHIIQELDNALQDRSNSILSSKFILVTGHRRENFGPGLISVCQALKDLASRYPEVNLVYPVHLNPNVKEPVYSMLNDIPNIFLIKPLSYLSFIYLMKHCYFILTDSGGIQEEAPAFGKPVLIMRDNTERPEAIRAGTAQLVGTDKKKIREFSGKLISDPNYYAAMSQIVNPYGDGKAAERIVNQLYIRYFT